MPGAYYVALSGMRTRLEALDRLASDIANASTTGYKSERTTTAQADRPSFGSALQTAIDVADGATRVDMRSGSITPTGRDLDVAIDGPGLFALETPGGPRYTRDGRLVRRSDGVLATSTGDALQSVAGAPIKIGTGPVQIDPNGTVRSGGAVAGRIKVVEFDDLSTLVRDGPYRFRAEGTSPRAATRAALRSGALEQSNVSVADRVTDITTVSRNFGVMQRALAVLANDVDARAITELGRRS